MNNINNTSSQNFYSQLNKQYFDEIAEITKSRPVHYLNIIRGKKHIVQWINDSVECLKDKKYDLRTKVYWIINGLIDFPICQTCKKKFKTNIRNLATGYGKYCSHSCSNSNKEHNKKIIETREKHKSEDKDFLKKIDEKKKKTKLERYGNPNYTNREKAHKTIKEKYGTDWFVQTSHFKEKAEKTYIEHYGVDHNWKSQQSRDKMKQTCLKLYGDENYNNREKSKQTSLKNYGVDNPTKSKIIQSKIRQTCLQRYGVDHNFKDEECKKKIRQTNIKKYGVPYPISFKYHYDNKYFDSSWEVAYYIWLKDNNIKFEYHTKTFEYKDKNGKTHTYELDFVVDNNGKQEYIEIKGPQFFNADGKFCDIFDKKTDENLAESKFNCMKINNVKILSEAEITPILTYINKQYGKNYIFNFKIK